MGRTIGTKQYEAEKSREESIMKVDRIFRKYGYEYLPCYPNILRNDPALRNPKTKKLMLLPLRSAKKITKKENENKIPGILKALERKYMSQER